MSSGDILIIAGAAFSAIAGALLFFFDQVRDQSDLQEKIEDRERERAKKEGRTASSIPDAGEMAEKRIAWERFLVVGVPLLVAVAANVAALVFG